MYYKFRDFMDVLTMHWFPSLVAVKHLPENWKKDTGRYILILNSSNTRYPLPYTIWDIKRRNPVFEPDIDKDKALELLQEMINLGVPVLEEVPRKYQRYVRIIM